MADQAQCLIDATLMLTEVLIPYYRDVLPPPRLTVPRKVFDAMRHDLRALTGVEPGSRVRTSLAGDTLELNGIVIVAGD